MGNSKHKNNSRQGDLEANAGVFSSLFFGIDTPAIGVDMAFADQAVIETAIETAEGAVVIEVTPPKEITDELLRHEWGGRDTFYAKNPELGLQLGELRMGLIAHWVQNRVESKAERALPDFDLEASFMQVERNEILPPFHQPGVVHLRFQALSPAFFAPLWTPDVVEQAGGWNAYAKQTKRDCILLNIANDVDYDAPEQLSRIFFCVIPENVLARIARIEDALSRLRSTERIDPVINPMLLDFLKSFNVATGAMDEGLKTSAQKIEAVKKDFLSKGASRSIAEKEARDNNVVRLKK